MYHLDRTYMVDILIKNNRIHPWQTFPAGYVKGYAFEGEVLLSEADIYNRCTDARLNDRLDELLYTLNGSFSVIISHKEETILIADKLKTYPLFYFLKRTDYTITDSGDTVIEQIPEVKLNALAVKEYVAAGYVSEDKTLVSGCKIVPAATYVCIGKSGISRHRYYSQHLLPRINDLSSLTPTVNHILERTMKRMLRIVGNRTIVIPLSGGYDSRLIACLCKKYKAAHVICYTYGIQGSPETEISRKVAGHLNFPWYYVEYTEEKWRKLLNSPVFESYMRYGGNLNTIPHIQDFLAIHELIEKKIIPEDAIVIPGHTGDVIGGSHLPANISRKTVARRIYDKYFDVNMLKNKDKQEILNYLQHSLETNFSLDSREDCYQAFHTWGVRSRQANFIVNSVKAYEINGLDWYLPLWDDEFEQYWNAIPCTQRVGSSLYNTYLFDTFFKPYQVDYYKSKAETHPPGYMRILRFIFSGKNRFLIKKWLEHVGLYTFPKDHNALDIVGRILMGKEFDKQNDYIRYSKPDSMCMKALFYLSLLHK